MRKMAVELGGLLALIPSIGRLNRFAHSSVDKQRTGRRHTDALRLVLVGIVLCQSGTAEATPITVEFDFVASGFFAPIGTATPPQDPVFGRFTVSYDTATVTSGGTLDSIDLTIAGFSYNTANTGFNHDSFDNLQVGGLSAIGIPGVAGTDDFVMSFPASSPSVNALFFYSTSSSLGPGFLAGNLLPPSNVVISSTIVPEPYSLTLLATGLAGLGSLMRRRRNVIAAEDQGSSGP